MHTQFAHYQKLIARVMLFLFLFTQVAIAATPQQQSPYTDPNATPATGVQKPQFANNSNQVLLGTADQLSNYYFNQFKNSYGWDWLKTTNINFSAFSDNTPQWNIQTFQPLTMKDNLDNFLFAQAQYGSNSNTLNAGLGYRTMSNSRNSLYGINLFYDGQFTVQGENGYTPSGSLMRVGAGLEYYTGPLEFRANGYYGVGSDVQIGALQTTGPEAGTTAWLHVAPGADLSVGSDFSFWNAPWAKLTATGSYYGQTQNGTINSYKGSALTGNLTASLQVLPQLQISAGVTGGNGGASSANIGFQLNLLAPPTPALLMADPIVNTMAATDISYKMLQPVQRNNTITIERYTKQATSYTTVSYTVANPAGGIIPGAVVTLQPGATGAVAASGGLSAITDINGKAVISNVPMTSVPYTVVVDASAQGYVAYSTALVVNTPDVNAATKEVLPYPVHTYDATITVRDWQGNTIDGATVKVGDLAAVITVGGVATIPAIGNARYSYEISKADYVSKTGTFTIAEAPCSLNAQLYQVTSVTFELASAQNPTVKIAGAVVTLGGTVSAPSDANGLTTITSVPVNGVTAYSVTDTSNYLGTSGTINIDSAVPVSKQLLLEPASTDTGAVEFTVACQNSPVVGARITVSGSSTIAITDNNGKATVTKLAVGSHNYSITADGLASASGTCSSTAGSTSQINVTMAPLTGSGILFTMKKTDGTAWASFLISGRGYIQNEWVEFSKVTDLDGSIFIPLAAGKYSVVLGDDNGIQPRKNLDVEVSEGQITMVSEQTCAVDVTLLYANGAPWSKGNVAASGGAYQVNKAVNTNGYVQYTLFPGQYSFSQNNYSSTVPDVAVTAEAGQTYTAVIQGAEVAVILRRGNGAPISGADVQFWNTVVYPIKTDTDGKGSRQVGTKTTRLLYQKDATGTDNTVYDIYTDEFTPVLKETRTITLSGTSVKTNYNGAPFAQGLTPTSSMIDSNNHQIYSKGVHGNFEVNSGKYKVTYGATDGTASDPTVSYASKVVDLSSGAVEVNIEAGVVNIVTYEYAPVTALDLDNLLSYSLKANYDGKIIAYLNPGRYSFDNGKTETIITNKSEQSITLK